MTRIQAGNPRDPGSIDTTDNYDVIVIGGGPAGSTAATFLAKKGWQVLMLEKDFHPRFHIGESLLPMSLPILEQLGVLEKIDKIGICKMGAEFNSTIEPNPRETFYFSDAWDKSHPHAYEVSRDQFDEILFRNAGANNVHLMEGCKAGNISFDTAGSATIEYLDQAKKQQYARAKFLLDASGRETLLSRRLGLKQKSRQHNSAALFGHFKNVQTRAGKDAGNISIYWFEHGWIWLIPLQGNVMSIGAVCYPEYLKQRRGSVADFFQQTLELVPEIKQRMQAATALTDISATGNFTYSSKRMYGPAGKNYLLLGDAYAFIDPVFSSGVQIAMTGARLAADTIDRILTDPRQRQSALAGYEKTITGALKTFSWLILRFNSPAMQKLFMAPGNQFRIKEALVSLLAGDLYRDTPLLSRLRLFKLIYYITFLGNFPQAWKNYRRRKRNVNSRFNSGTTAQDKIDP